MSSKTEEILEAWGAFFVAHALAIRQIEDSLSKKAMLSLDEYDVLLGISRSEGGKIRYSALASATVFTRSGITRVVRRLEKRGLIERLECPEDRRGAFASLTNKGKKTMQETWKLYSKEILAVFDSCFDQADAKQFKVLLEKVIGNLRCTPLIQIGKRK